MITLSAYELLNLWFIVNKYIFMDLDYANLGHKEILHFIKKMCQKDANLCVKVEFEL
jgi:hypothetical protein